MASLSESTDDARVEEIEDEIEIEVVKPEDFVQSDEVAPANDKNKEGYINLRGLVKAVGVYGEAKNVTIFPNDIRTIMILFLHKNIEIYRADKNLASVEECKLAHDGEIFLKGEDRSP